MEGELSKNSTELCYFCGKPSTSKEHVPPKCLFPEAKDLKDGKNYRNNLITVPSCDIHNTEKSGLDEHLLQVLSWNRNSNSVGQKQADTKVSRATIRNPNLFGKFIPIKNSNAYTAIKIKNPEKIKEAFEHIARGLFFHHFGNRWNGTLRIREEFIFFSNNNKNKNKNLKDISEFCDNKFFELTRYGDNPEVFFYQISQDNTSPNIFMRLSFYEFSRVLLEFQT